MACSWMHEVSGGGGGAAGDGGRSRRRRASTSSTEAAVAAARRAAFMFTQPSARLSRARARAFFGPTQLPFWTHLAISPKLWSRRGHMMRRIGQSFVLFCAVAFTSGLPVTVDNSFALQSVDAQGFLGDMVTNGLRKLLGSSTGSDAASDASSSGLRRLLGSAAGAGDTFFGRLFPNGLVNLKLKGPLRFNLTYPINVGVHTNITDNTLHLLSQARSPSNEAAYREDAAQSTRRLTAKAAHNVSKLGVASSGILDYFRSSPPPSLPSSTPQPPSLTLSTPLSTPPSAPPSTNALRNGLVGVDVEGPLDIAVTFPITVDTTWNVSGNTVDVG